MLNVYLFFFQFDYSFSQWLQLRKEAEHELREQLKRQSQVFADHLDEAVATRAMEIERNLARKFDEQLEKESTTYKMELAAMVGRLRGLDTALKGLSKFKNPNRNFNALSWH